LAGGCALNVSANGKIIQNKIYQRIYIPPCPHDAGAAVGAAVLSASSYLRLPLSDFIFDSPYLGPIYDESDIKKALEISGLKYFKVLDCEELVTNVATYLSSGSIVSWYQGRSEFGPRALGNRSLLADPRSDEVRDLINEKVKQRELFRPFAPSCKLEVVNDYFDINQESPYMNIASNVLPSARNIIPAVTHVDGTARVHTVDKLINERYWRLIDAFEKITGVGVLLNTSFNIQEPIVETPEDAISCFKRSGIDYLVIDNFIVER
jgi:carbamoyltransferase